MTEHGTGNGPYPIGRGPLPPVPTGDELAQWETMCRYTEPAGMCTRPVIDSAEPIKLCVEHAAAGGQLVIRALMNRGRS